MESPRPKDIGKYLAEMVTRFWPTLAGGSSVATGLYGTFIAITPNAKLFYYITAAIAFFWSGFLIWLKEHQSYQKEYEARLVADETRLASEAALAEYA